MEFVIGIVVLAGIGYSVWVSQNAGKAVVHNMGPAMREWFSRSGYRHAQIVEAPMEQQIQQSMVLAEQQRKGNSDIHMVRGFAEHSVHWRQWTRLTGSGYSTGCEWSVPVNHNLRALFHIADKSYGGAGQRVKGFMSNTTHSWSPAYPHRVATGDAALDERFQVYCNDPSALHVLSNPSVKAMLLERVEVDLVVRAHEVVFFDPAQNNLRSAMGGTAGMMKVAADPSQAMMMSLPLHDAIAQLLVAAAASAA